MWSGCSEEEIRARVRSGALPEWRERSHGRASLESICRRALALSPADRPATALELADDLEAALPQLGRPPTHREIGATLARLFADVRAQTREAIERKLGPLSAGAMAAAIDPSVNRTTETSLPLPQQATASGMASPRARRWVWLGTTAAVAALLAAFGLWRTGVFSSGRRALVETAPLAPAPAPPTPASAAPAARAAETAVEAPRPERSPAAPRVPGRRAPRPTSSANPPVPPPPDCAHPFFVDGDGIKRFRPECL
jgi:hypothetical protein